jgi:uncharacterized protein (TIGR02453 family)
MSIIPWMTTARSTAFPSEGLQFLKRLKRNNNRDWFNANKATYEEWVKKPMLNLIDTMALEFEKFAPEIQASAKVSFYRIYRDTRFSKDKTPYKTHAAAVFPLRGMQKHEGAGFYFHIAPTEVFVGGGLYMSLPEDLQAVREAIASRHQQFRRIVTGSSFRKMFGALMGEQLTRVPRGFSAEHPAADYLRYKQFLGARTLESSIAVAPAFSKTLAETFKTLTPLVQFLNEPILANRRHRERKESLLL